jgi:hypothetical protein
MRFPLRLLPLLTIFFASYSPADPILISAGTKLEVRLAQPLGSRISHVGDSIEATVIAPIFEDGKLAVPTGSTVIGTVERVDRLGLGLKHLTASVTVTFRELRFENGKSSLINGQVEDVETAREKVSPTGTRLVFEPYTAAPALAVKFLTARSPDPEIYFAAGTELIVRLRSNAEVDSSVKSADVVHGLSAEEVTNVQKLLQALPEQRTNRGRDHPSDLVNLLFLGNRDELEKTFHAAGWTGAQPHNVMALYRMFHCAVQRTGYRMAPMTKLTLNGLAPDAAYQKSLDTFAKRHHIRVWQQAAPGVWLGAATEDTGYGFTHMHMTHATDRNIDNERAKVVNDLAFTGCVDAGSLIPRDALKPVVAATSSIVTDGQIAALRLNGCKNPRAFPVASRIGPQPRLRIVQIMAAMFNDVVRSNPISLGYELTKSLAGSEHRRVKEYGTLAEARRQKAEAADLRRDWKRPTVVTSAPSIVAKKD